MILRGYLRLASCQLSTRVFSSHAVEALSEADRARLQHKIQALVHKGPLAPARLVAAIRGLARRLEGRAAHV